MEIVFQITALSFSYLSGKIMEFFMLAPLLFLYWLSGTPLLRNCTETLKERVIFHWMRNYVRYALSFSLPSFACRRKIRPSSENSGKDSMEANNSWGTRLRFYERDRETDGQEERKERRPKRKKLEASSFPPPLHASRIATALV
jgi:hypothetical protein